MSGTGTWRRAIAIASAISGMVVGACAHDNESFVGRLGGAPGPAFVQGFTWSPDGERIAITARIEGNFDIYVVDDPSQPWARITSAPEPDLYAVWSPEGRALIYGSRKSGNSEIYRRELTTGAEDVLAPAPGSDHSPAVSSRGDVAFSSDRSGGNTRIYVLERGATAPRALTPPDLPSAYGPDWSSDGRRVVFYTDAGDGRDQVWVIDADGQNLRRVTAGDGMNIFPSWSPDNRMIVFARREGGGAFGIVQIDVGSGELTRMTDADGVSRIYPRWSPDGSRLGFIEEGEGVSAIVVMRPQPPSS